MQEIDYILSNNELSFEDVIVKPDFLRSIRAEYSPSIDYLMNPANFRQVLKWSLKTDCQGHKDYNKISNVVVEVLTTPCYELQTQISEDDGFAAYLVRFLDSPAISSCIVCGHYYSIFSSFLRFTKGSFLSTIPSVHVELVTHIDMLPILMLLSEILLSYFEYVPDFDEISSLICSQILLGGVSGENSIDLMHNFVSKWENKTSFPSISNILHTLFQAALESASDSYSYKSLCLIALIFKRLKKYVDIGTKYMNSFDFDKDSIIQAPLFEIYPMKALERIDLLFEYPSNTFMRNAIYDAVLSLKPSDLVKLIESKCLAPKIISAFSRCKFNGHVVELAKLVCNMRSQASSLQSLEWVTFEADVLWKKTEIMRKSYGSWTKSVEPVYIQQSISPIPDEETVFVKKFSFDSDSD